ncbi:uncharacterized protein DUF4835 [Lutibacter sp. Hel_I_33_5]|uniref:type IX secretion system protein PorD n=1 Tax=Lutibacter sp. Hel_I_33_5 TaxID=1566289 RepID=UPI0011A9EB90|nr:DUF4835 family protein [Lutibacter sp. Hel_I_33_5]TVZ55416.1 uncharacterized protein DUF4835 [Lutibacter sp. Hel_I_33_5]
MRKLVFLIGLFLMIGNVNSQELNCLVTVNHNQIAGSNKQVFVTLERALTEFINQTKWTDKEVEIEEKINCAINIIVTARNNNNFEASIQVQSTRPIYGSTYASPLLNLNDDDFSFKYNEFDPLIFNPNSFDSNLVSTIVFYVYTILGMDADSFSVKGGEVYLKAAQNAALQAQQSGLAAWENQVGKQNRFMLIDNLLSRKLGNFRTVNYDYHRFGLDNFVKDPKESKQAIENAVIKLETIYNKSIGNYLIRLFFDAKADEIVNVYSDETKTNQQQRLITAVRKISPNNNPKWQKIN